MKRLFITGLQADGNDPVERGENEEGAEKEDRRISVTKVINRGGGMESRALD